MATEKRCPQCDRPLSDDAPEGLCPHCLLTPTVEGGESLEFPPMEEVARHFPNVTDNNGNRQMVSTAEPEFITQVLMKIEDGRWRVAAERELDDDDKAATDPAKKQADGKTDLLKIIVHPGEYRLSGKVSTIAAIKQRLQQKDITAETIIQIRVHPDTAENELAAILDLCQQSGLARVNILTLKPETGDATD